MCRKAPSWLKGNKLSELPASSLNSHYRATFYSTPFTNRRITEFVIALQGLISNFSFPTTHHTALPGLADPSRFPPSSPTPSVPILLLTSLSYLHLSHPYLTTTHSIPFPPLMPSVLTGSGVSVRRYKGPRARKWGTSGLSSSPRDCMCRLGLETPAAASLPSGSCRKWDIEPAWRRVAWKNTGV